MEVVGRWACRQVMAFKSYRRGSGVSEEKSVSSLGSCGACGAGVQAWWLGGQGTGTRGQAYLMGIGNSFSWRFVVLWILVGDRFVFWLPQPEYGTVS